MYLSVGWSCDGLTLSFAVVIGQLENSFDTSVSFRDIENQNGDFAMVWACRQMVYIEDNWILKKYR